MEQGTHKNGAWGIWKLHPWRHWKQYEAPSNLSYLWSWLCFEKEGGLDDLRRSVPIWVILCKKDTRVVDRLKRWNNHFTLCVWRNPQVFNVAGCTIWALRRYFHIQKCSKYLVLFPAVFIYKPQQRRWDCLCKQFSSLALCKILVSTIYVLKNVNHLWNLTSGYQDMWIQTGN